MINIEQLKLDIIKRLKPLNLERVVLFGSYAYGTPNDDSDIDLYIVTKDKFVPQSFREKSALTKSVSRAIRDLRTIIPIDLIVHTKLMSEKFIELDSSFSQEIHSKGTILI